MGQKKLTAKMIYNDYLRSFAFLDSKKHKTETEIIVLEKLGCIKKGELKAGPRGGIIKVNI